jgi:hypothetical protein
MNTPGFTAEASLERVTREFRGVWKQHQSADSAVTSQSCDPSCWEHCETDCSYCDDLPANEVGRCIRACVAANLRRCIPVCCS